MNAECGEDGASRAWPGAETPWGEPPAQGLWDGLLEQSVHDRATSHPAERQRGLGSRGGSALAACSFPHPTGVSPWPGTPATHGPVGYTLPNIFYLNANFDFSLSQLHEVFHSAARVTIIIYPQALSYRYCSAEGLVL